MAAACRLRPRHTSVQAAGAWADAFLTRPRLSATSGWQRRPGCPPSQNDDLGLVAARVATKPSLHDPVLAASSGPAGDARHRSGCPVPAGHGRSPGAQLDPGWRSSEAVTSRNRNMPGGALPRGPRSGPSSPRRSSEQGVCPVRQRRLGRFLLLRREHADPADRQARRRGHPVQQLHRRVPVHPDAVGDPDRPPVGPVGHLHGADTRPGTERPGAVGVHDRRVAVGRRLRDVAVGQVASRRRRGAAAERSGLRRVVGLQEQRRRVRLHLLRDLPGGRQGQGTPVAPDLGGQEGPEVHRGPGAEHGGAPGAGRADRRQGDRLHRAPGQGGQAVLHLCRSLPRAPAGAGAPRFRPDRSRAPGPVRGPDRGDGLPGRADRRLRRAGRDRRQHDHRVLQRQRDLPCPGVRIRRLERAVAR